MAEETTTPGQAAAPKLCGGCQSTVVKPHCPQSPTCDWVNCPSCGATTAIVFGQLRSVGGKA
jgi:hypothetical protein